MLGLKFRTIAEEVILLQTSGTLLLGPDTAKFRSCMQGLRGEYREVQLDLTGLSRMDAAGIGVLVEAYAQCQVAGTSVRLYDVSYSVHELLYLVKLFTVFGPCIAHETIQAA